MQTATGDRLADHLNSGFKIHKMIYVASNAKIETFSHEKM
jgi:hypothetical protein